MTAFKNHRIRANTYTKKPEKQRSPLCINTNRYLILDVGSKIIFNVPKTISDISNSIVPANV